MAFPTLAVGQHVTNSVGLQVATEAGCTTGTGPAAGVGLTYLAGNCTSNNNDGPRGTGYVLLGYWLHREWSRGAYVANPSSLTTATFTVSEYAATNIAAARGTISCRVIHN
jgi:hypothetical protein